MRNLLTVLMTGATALAATHAVSVEGVRNAHAASYWYAMLDIPNKNMFAGTVPAMAFAQQPGHETASIPDFSGTWAKPYLGFEPPRAGPGPVTNRSRRNGVRDAYQHVGDYTNPILKAQAAEVVKNAGDMELSGVPHPTPANQCWPVGAPLVFWSIGMQLIQQPHQVTILYVNDHEFRQVRLNEVHSWQMSPSWYGDSVGHYEGDTLVVDTVGMKVGPFAMLDAYGTPFTQALHVVERYRLIDEEAAKESEERGLKENPRLPDGAVGLVMDPDYKGKALQLEFTVEDEGVFTMPWSATATYRRALGTVPENVCAENLRGTHVTKDSATPRADKPDF